MTGPMWRQHRPGCLDPQGLVACTPQGTDGTVGWVGVAAGVVVALFVLLLRGRALVAARVTVIVMVTWSGAMVGAGYWDAARPRAAVCVFDHVPGGPRCAYPPSQVHDLYLTGVVSLVLGLLVVSGEAASRQALDVPSVGWRRVLVATLMTGAVPLGLFGLLLVAQDAGVGEVSSLAGLPCVVAAVLALAIGQLLRTVGGRQPSPSLGQA
jgi:hypothetical protein